MSLVCGLLQHEKLRNRDAFLTIPECRIGWIKISDAGLKGNGKLSCLKGKYNACLTQYLGIFFIQFVL